MSNGMLRAMLRGMLRIPPEISLLRGERQAVTRAVERHKAGCYAA